MRAAKTREVLYIQLLALLRTSPTPRGRRNLAEELKIGEGVARALLEAGRHLGHIYIMRGGAKITEAGEAFLRDVFATCKIGAVMPINEAGKYLCGKRCLAFIIDDKIPNAVAMRDELVRLGACGALIVEKREDLVLPPTYEKLSKYIPQLAENLSEHLSQSQSAVVTCGETYADAMGFIQVRCKNLLTGDEENPADM